MFGAPILDVTIGLMFVYLVLSLIASALREGIESWLKSRAGQLELGIRTLLDDLQGKGLAREIYEHPLVSGLFTGEYKPPTGDEHRVRHRTDLPSYIPSRNFAVALLDIIAHSRPPASGAAETQPITLEDLRGTIQQLTNTQVRRALLSVLDNAEGSVRRAQASIEAWYDSAMDRVSGWYKRETQGILIFIGLGIAVVGNVNSFDLAEHLYRDKASREVLVAHAGQAGSLEKDLPALRAELTRLDLPIGWDNAKFSAPWSLGSEWRRYPWWENLLEPVLGWIMTALAISLGAPFWFDLLNKMMVVRSTVKPHEKSGEEGSEDRPLPRTIVVTAERSAMPDPARRP
jgi:hypothetical protein